MASNQRRRPESERNRSISSTSRLYCEDHETTDQKMQSFLETVEAQPPRNLKTKQSKPLPFWAWYIIAKVNGIPLRHNEKPIFGTFVHAFTLCCSLTYVASYIWYVVYDIMSPNTPRDIPGGTVSIFLVICWCAFGFYCKTLSSRLFFHGRFLKDVRMHSRTIFKINAGVLVVILGTLFTAASVVETSFFMNWKHCTEIELDVLVCTVLTVSNILFSVLTLVWHSLVAFVFLSVCRTHTIALRRFVKEIERDSVKLQRQCSLMFKNISNIPGETWDETLWMIEDGDGSPFHPRKTQSNDINAKPVGNSSNVDTHNREGEISILLSPVSENIEVDATYFNSEEKKWNEVDSPRNQQLQTFAALSEEENSSTNAAQPMSCSEILHNYYKLNCRLRFSACALQRWFASFIALVLLRCSTYLIHWLAHEATVLDVLQFVLPLILLVVLSSAIAEVNFEGQRVWRCLYPIESRLQMLQFLVSNPLVMPIYGFGMTHGTIVTVVFAILVGFVTRIVMTELTEMNQRIQQQKTSQMGLVS